MRRTPRHSETHASVDVRIEKLVYGGDALARDQNKVYLVPFALPGELATIQPLSERRQIMEARVERILESSPERTSPSCSIFGTCGGCRYQHASYAYQLIEKQNIVRDVFRRVAKLELPREVRLVAGPAWGYRNRIQAHVGMEGVGFHRTRSEVILPTHQCPIADPLLNQSLHALHSIHKRSLLEGIGTLDLFTNDEHVQVNAYRNSAERRKPSILKKGTVARASELWKSELVQLVPQTTFAPIEYKVFEHGFRVSPGSFFQANRFLVHSLVEIVLEDTEPGNVAFDLYAGVGLLTKPISRHFKHTIAVESSPKAAADLEFNLRGTESSIALVCENVGSFVKRSHKDVDHVVADPPRAGLGAPVVRELARIKPKTLTLVSCDPSTQARDVDQLCRAGYELVSFAILDMFPQTAHVETVARLRKTYH